MIRFYVFLRKELHRTLKHRNCLTGEKLYDSYDLFSELYRIASFLPSFLSHALNILTYLCNYTSSENSVLFFIKSKILHRFYAFTRLELKLSLKYSILAQFLKQTWFTFTSKIFFEKSQNTNNKNQVSHKNSIRRSPKISEISCQHTKPVLWCFVSRYYLHDKEENSCLLYRFLYWEQFLINNGKNKVLHYLTFFLSQKEVTKSENTFVFLIFDYFRQDYLLKILWNYVTFRINTFRLKKNDQVWGKGWNHFKMNKSFKRKLNDGDFQMK